MEILVAQNTNIKNIHVFVRGNDAGDLWRSREVSFRTMFLPALKRKYRHYSFLVSISKAGIKMFPSRVKTKPKLTSACVTRNVYRMRGSFMNASKAMSRSTPLRASLNWEDTRNTVKTTRTNPTRPCHRFNILSARLLGQT